jgi:LSD1 subclass zinc finger protein
LRRYAKAPSANTAARMGTTRARRTLFGLACLCVLVLAAFAGSGAPSAGAEGACPNEARRAEQHSTELPDCRGYEMVSPLDKNGADVLRTNARFRVATDGGAVGWAALAGFADTQGVSVAADYMSQRTDSGWLTHALTPRQRSLSWSDARSFQEPLYTGPYSADLTRGVFASISPLTDDPGVASVLNLYLRTDLRTPGPGSFQLITACPLCDATETPLPPLTGDNQSIIRGRPFFANVSPDFGRVIFESRARLTSDAPPQPETCDPTTSSSSAPAKSGACRLRLYEWDQGTLRYAGFLPDGSPADVSIAAAGAGSFLTPGALSDGTDGHDRVFFTQPTNASGQTSSQVSGANAQQAIDLSSLGNLFVRVDHQETAQLNLSERTTCAAELGGFPPCEPAPDSFGRAKFLDASADGTRSFFMTAQALTDDAPVDGLQKIYMYDATKSEADPHNLTFVSRDDELGDGTGNAQGAIGVSADGHYFYFVNDTQLVSGGPTDRNTWIYLWHDGQLKVVGPADQISVGLTELLINAKLWQLTPLQARVTPDGRHLLFSDTMGESLTGYDDGNCEWGLDGSCRELYVYSADSDSVACASCNPSGAAATGNATIWVGEGGATRADRPNTQPITPDGSRVFFTTPEALVPEDTNGFLDAYEYDTEAGSVSLVSSGTEESDSYFIDNSPSGDDAFFATRERLVGYDTDDSYDLYDARVGGGFPEPPPELAPCNGDSCKGGAGVTPPAPPLGSSTLTGAGNVKGRRGCPRGRRPVRRHGKVVCVKRHGKKRDARRDRRAAR